MSKASWTEPASYTHDKVRLPFGVTGSGLSWGRRTWKANEDAFGEINRVNPVLKGKLFSFSFNISVASFSDVLQVSNWTATILKFSTKGCMLNEIQTQWDVYLINTKCTTVSTWHFKPMLYFAWLLFSPLPPLHPIKNERSLTFPYKLLYFNEVWYICIRGTDWLNMQNIMHRALGVKKQVSTSNKQSFSVIAFTLD